MSYHVKCTRCSTVADAVVVDGRPQLPKDWGRLIVEQQVGEDVKPWESKYNDAHLCPNCQTDLVGFLRGCPTTKEAGR
jgi:hypothetical protein